MLGAAALFFGLQVLAPILGSLLAYTRCHYQRLQGVSGHQLEGQLGGLGFVASAAFSLAFFYAWPEGATSCSRLPGLRWIFSLTLLDPAQSDPTYPLVKMMVAGAFALTAGLIAKINAFSLTRRLVRDVPRYYRAKEPVGKR